MALPTTADIFHDRCARGLKGPDAEQWIKDNIEALKGRIYDGDFDPLQNNIDDKPVVFVVFPDDSTASAGNYGSGWFAEQYDQDYTKYNEAPPAWFEA